MCCSVEDAQVDMGRILGCTFWLSGCKEGEERESTAPTNAKHLGLFLAWKLFFSPKNKGRDGIGKEN